MKRPPRLWCFITAACAKTASKCYLLGWELTLLPSPSTHPPLSHSWYLLEPHWTSLVAAAQSCPRALFKLLCLTAEPAPQISLSIWSRKHPPEVATRKPCPPERAKFKLKQRGGGQLSILLTVWEQSAVDEKGPHTYLTSSGKACTAALQTQET